MAVHNKCWVWLLLTRDHEYEDRSKILQTVGTTNIETYQRHVLSISDLFRSEIQSSSCQIFFHLVWREPNTTVTVYDQSSPVKLTVGKKLTSWRNVKTLVSC